ncbi:MAG: hypothetical protein GY842_12495, partial [bacterium]|nr:hypothetical protein [bacterium]
MATRSFTGLRLRARAYQVITSAGFKEEYFLVALSIVIGCATGAGAFLFYRLIEWATHQAYGDGGLFR